MLKKPIKCICCGKVSEPEDGVHLDSHGGNDGSAVYDNVTGSQPTFVRALICDACFVLKLQTGSLQAYVMPEVRRPDPIAVFWDPAKGDFDYGEGPDAKKE